MVAQRFLMALSVVLLFGAPQFESQGQAPLAAPDPCDHACGRTAAPAITSSPYDITSIWGGARESIALRADGTVWTWGWNNCDPNNFSPGPCGKLGDGTNITRTVPVEVHGPGNSGFLDSVTAIMGGEHHNLALRADGTVWAWGANFVGQLGNGTFTDTETPVQVSGLFSVTKLGGRGYHSLAVTADGKVWAWGWNRNGELGHDTTGQPCSNIFGTCSTVPVQVLGISNPLTVTGGGFFSLALMLDHTVMGWGANESGELGDGTYISRSAPVQVSAVLSHVVNISAGWQHAVALTDDGRVWTWGNNFDGEIGNGVTSTQGLSLPYQVPGLTNVIGVSGGDGFTGILKADGTVWTWGYNRYGQLGNGTFVNSSTPVQVPGLGQVKLFAARDYHDLAVRLDGTVWAWGSGQNGELGDGQLTDSAVPVEVLFGPTLPLRWLWLPLTVQ